MTDGGIVLLDIGNSAAKWVSIDSSGAITRGRTPVDELERILAANAMGSAVLIASVADEGQDAALADALERANQRVWFAKPRATLNGLVNSYSEPEKMGVDRWLAMLAAWSTTRQRLCVVDAGSALTIDLVDADGRHEGGYIIPGGHLMQRALLNDTQRVRFRPPAEASLAPGRSTAEAVAHGALLAQAGAVVLAMHEASGNGETPQLFFCGGGAAPLGSVMEAGASAPDLVFDGLLMQFELEAPWDLDVAVARRALQADQSPPRMTPAS